MGSWAYLRLGELTLCASKSDVDPSVMVLFAGTDKRSEIPQVATSDVEGEDEPHATLEYRASLKIVKDRLELMGFSLNSVKSAFQAGVEEELAENDQYSRHLLWSRTEGMRDLFARRMAILREMTFDSWLDAFAFIVRERLRPDGQLWYN